MLHTLVGISKKFTYSIISMKNHLVVLRRRLSKAGSERATQATMPKRLRLFMLRTKGKSTFLVKVKVQAVISIPCANL
ncbi:MAG: hypothetical protein CMO55_11925 [Verrucomicrobiales bacterium]|nr:hypothetical protein [Verrucomicrobiales bacterium]